MDRSDESETTRGSDLGWGVHRRFGAVGARGPAILTERVFGAGAGAGGPDTIERAVEDLVGALNRGSGC
jgi:hypothetical protein